MSSLPNEIFSDMTKFLPNDDITDLMLMSRKFNALVTPRLKKITEKIATTNQSVESFMPLPEPDLNDNEWIAQLNLKRFMPVDPEAKKRMKDIFENQVDLQNCLLDIPGRELIPRKKIVISFSNFEFCRQCGRDWNVLFIERERDERQTERAPHTSTELICIFQCI